MIIDFLFYLKEKGNKYDHFDESILNHILFDDSIKEKNNKNEEVKNNKNFVFKTEYEGKKIFSGKELIKIFKNPLEYHRKNIKFNNLFEIVYKKIEDLKKEMGYNNTNTKLVKIINKANGLECEIKQLKEIIQMDIKNFSNIDFKNIDKININEINDEYLKKLLNNYSLLENLYKEIFDKIKFYEDKQNKFISLEKLIFGIENEINTYINIIQYAIKKNAELIQISNFFGEYKIELKNNFMKKKEYIDNKVIFSEKNINEFTLNNVFNFLQEYLKDYNFCIYKRDVPNFNLFVEIINTFDELKDIFEDDLDVKI